MYRKECASNTLVHKLFKVYFLNGQNSSAILSVTERFEFSFFYPIS